MGVDGGDVVGWGSEVKPLETVLPFIVGDHRTVGSPQGGNPQRDLGCGKCLAANPTVESVSPAPLAQVVSKVHQVRFMLSQLTSWLVRPTYLKKVETGPCINSSL